MNARSGHIAVVLILLISGFFQWRCGSSGIVRVSGRGITIEFDRALHSRVVSDLGGKRMEIGPFAPSETVRIGGRDLEDFMLLSASAGPAADGKGKCTVISGQADSIRKEVRVTVMDEFPALALFRVSYTNLGKRPVHVERWVNHHYRIRADRGEAGSPMLWSYQGGSYEDRPDWILPIHSGFSQQNFMGMNASDYGGGTPVVDVWRREIGLGVGHAETVPKLVSLPVEMPDSCASLGIFFPANRVLQSGEKLETFETFVSVHRGDFFSTLSEYRRLLESKGIRFTRPPAASYEPIWCAWGYERKFTMDQIYEALPMAAKLGFAWACLDDGWQTNEGDWALDPKKYPGGDKDMKTFVGQIHASGLKAQLWWAPLAVDPGSDLIRNHPEYLLLNEDGSPQKISWWDSYYLCPAYAPVVEYTQAQVRMIMENWGYEGLKIDGQHLNAAPPCYNPAHHHARPEESFEKVPDFFKAIHETAIAIHPEALIELCPCGTAYSFFTMPYFNQSVASDPESSWQIRLKGKTIKALMGPDAAYFGDHVELSDGHDDFASTVGVGGIVGTKFTWPPGSARRPRYDLTPEKEAVWAQWTKIYKERMLSTGEYLGELYDIGFDRPEAHVIRKDGAMYYAFYADAWEGELELRGLKNKTYTVMDYVNGIGLGEVKGPAGRVQASFRKFLLLEAREKTMGK